MKMTKDSMYKPSFFISTLAFYFIMMPLDFLPIISGFSLSKALVFIPLIGMILCIESFGFIKKSSLLILFYPLAIIISMFGSIDFDASVDRMISVLLNVMVVVCLSSRRYSKQDLEYLFKAAAFSGWILFLLCIVFANYSEDGRLTIVINGVSQDQNYLCGFLILPICYYIWDFLQNKSKFGLMSAILFSILIFLTGSRGGTLSLLVSLLILLLGMAVTSRGKLWKIIIFLLVSMIFITLIWDFLPEEITIRFSMEFNKEDQGAHRLEIWESLFKHFKKSSFSRQVFGNGAGTVSLYSFEERVAHNVFIEALVEMGLLGTSLIIAMYVYYGLLSVKTKKPFLSASFLGYMLMCMTLSLYSYKPIWNIILIIILTGCSEKQMKLSTQTIISL